MSPEYIASLQSLDRSDIIFRELAVNPWGRIVKRELCAQSDGAIVLHTFSDDPEDTDNFDVERLDGVNLVSWLRDNRSDDTEWPALREAY